MILKAAPAGEVDLAIVHLTFEGIQTYGGGVATAKTLAAIYPQWSPRFDRARERLAKEDLSLALQARSA